MLSKGLQRGKSALWLFELLSLSHKYAVQASVRYKLQQGMVG